MDTTSATAGGTLPCRRHAAAAARAAQASCHASPARLGACGSQAEARQGCRAVTEAGLRVFQPTCSPGLLLPSGPWLLVLMVWLGASKAQTMTGKEGR